MSSGKTTAVVAIRWMLTAILLSTAAKFYYHKLRPDVTALSSADLKQICASVTGCRSLQIKVRDSAQFGHATMSIEAVADRRRRSDQLVKQVEDEVHKAWSAESTIFSAPWDKHSIKVTYE